MDDRPILHYSEMHILVQRLISEAVAEIHMAGNPTLALDLTIRIAVFADSFENVKNILRQHIRLDNWDNN
jgi:hypothetical protein